jgi:hypothetical protein
MTTLKVGIASYEEMKARTMAVARVERRVSCLVDNAFNLTHVPHDATKSFLRFADRIACSANYTIFIHRVNVSMFHFLSGRNLGVAGEQFPMPPPDNPRLIG